MSTPRENLLCRYQYDPLDRLAGQDNVQRFYLKNRLIAEVDGSLARSLFQYETGALAEHVHSNGEVVTTLLATDHQTSVIGAVAPLQHAMFAYSPYGNHDLQSGALSLLRFTGERRDSVTGHYLLGNGYRAFNPTVMRFNSPDSLSPFGKGGLNAYVYCLGDPINANDPSGHTHNILKGFLNLFGRQRSSSRQAAATVTVEASGGPSASTQAAHVTAQLPTEPPSYSALYPEQAAVETPVLTEQSRLELMEKMKSLKEHNARLKKAEHQARANGQRVPSGTRQTRNSNKQRITEIKKQLGIVAPPPPYSLPTLPPYNSVDLFAANNLNSRVRR